MSARDEYIELTQKCVELRKKFLRSAFVGFFPLWRRVIGKDSEFERILREDLRYQAELKKELNGFLQAKPYVAEDLKGYLIDLKSHGQRLRFRGRWLVFYSTIVTICIAALSHHINNSALVLVLMTVVVTLPILLERQALSERDSVYNEIVEHIQGFLRQSNKGGETSPPYDSRELHCGLEIESNSG